MPVISRNALVMFNCQQMYQLINDISAYPEFLSDCGDSKIIAQSPDKMTASLLVSKGGLKKWFTTENTLVENEQVHMSLLDGPFKYLNGKWQLTPLSEEACKVSLHLDYEFSSKVLDLAFGRVFNNIANNMVQAFTERAKHVYGANIG
ncbi:type II toxin-antitoxin system RatA family toxin [Thalassotalea sp. PP2-459]|uniref:type II toxin-antitoxin system RatA family toxin n=1 Tax=Thalassotalea sp. PP2-459 TaxID=1742724 RepID=UPI0009445936|nr:type II toxin-antitoxin system RatA family toxin [Thalassotalea sp. PP2-459]OKY27662.1 ubiquinone-binding protein [Thalassotalea sp. PP2-459]